MRDRVHLVGYLDADELEEAYGAADCFVQPCREEPGGDTEGFGLVFLEANVRGLPVVAGRTGGVPEAVLDGLNGLLVEPGDADRVADAMRRLLTDHALARRLGEAGRRRVLDGFLPQHYAQRVLAVVS